MMYFNNLFNTTEFKRFACPGRYFLGSGCRERVFDLLEPAEDHKVLLVVDRVFENDSFTLKIARWLDQTGIALYGPVIVHAEPTTAFIDNLIGDLRGVTIDAIIAIGGGSTIDSAKAVLAYSLHGEYRRIGYEAFREIREPPRRVKVIALPTTPATGAEASRYYLISDAATGRKLVSRAWWLVPEWTLLDPDFLKSAPDRLIVLSCFDAFLHLWETLSCRHESSVFGEMLSVYGLTLILRELRVWQQKGTFSEAGLERLMAAAAIGGVALSNARTGLIHNAGEMLSAQTSLTHPETLIVFYRAVLKHYHACLSPAFDDLFATLAALCPGGEPGGVHGIIAFWEALFRNVRVRASMHAKIMGANLDTEAIVQALLRDRVWTEKESPRLLDEPAIRRIVCESIQSLTEEGS